MRFFLIVIITITALFAGTMAAGAQTTGDTLSAPVVKDQLNVITSGKDVDFTLDDKKSTDGPLSGRLFVVRGPITVTVANPNPLRVQVSGGIEDAVDPSNAAIVKLVEALLQIQAVVQPGAAAAAQDTSRGRAQLDAAGVAPVVRDTCINETNSIIQGLYDDLYPSAATGEVLTRDLKTWAERLDVNAGGIRTRLQGVLDLIDTRAGAIGNSVEAAKKKVALMEATRESTDQTPCIQYKKTLFSLALLSRPTDRLGELQRIRGTLTTLKDNLVTFRDREDNWFGNGVSGAGVDYYVVARARPAVGKIQKVTVKFVKLEYSAPDGSSGVILKTSDAASATFTVRRAQLLVAEYSGGLIRSKLGVPKYGTSKAADGQTIVKQVSTDEVSWDTAVMVNFVCICGTGDYLTPMLQIGALPSKANPALLFGIGLRLIGLAKGSFGFAVGKAVGRVKQLDDKFVNQSVDGTFDIESNLKFVDKTSTYFTFQYIF